MPKFALPELEELLVLRLENRVLIELESYAEIDAIKITPLTKKLLGVIHDNPYFLYRQVGSDSEPLNLKKLLFTVPPLIRKPAHFVCFPASCEANFAHVWAVPASQFCLLEQICAFVQAQAQTHSCNQP
jgi:hypothetical protein